MKQLKQLNERERSLLALLQLDGKNDESTPTTPQAPPLADEMFRTRSSITVTRIETPTITEQVQSQLFESTVEQTIEQPSEQPLVIPEPSEQVRFKPDAGAGTSRSFRTRSLSATSSNVALRNGKPKKRIKNTSIRDAKAGEKYDPKKYLLLLDYTDIKDKHPNLKEEIYYPFKVKQPDDKTLEIENRAYFEEKHQQHPVPPTPKDKEKAKKHGFVLEDDWKTQFTIKAFHGTRKVGAVVQQVAVEFSSGPVQWENVQNLKNNARSSLIEYFRKLKISDFDLIN